MKKAISIFFYLILLISCDKEVFTGFVEPDQVNFEKIFVTSNPKGYRLFIDNKFMNAFSPDSIRFISQGIYKLTLKHDLFSDSSLSISVQKNIPLTVAIDMMRNPRFFAKVNCSTNPQGAKIFFNDHPTGMITPAIITQVYPGEIEIKFSKNQFRDDSVLVKLKGGESAGISRGLEDTSRTVSYRTNNSKITSNLLTKVVVDKSNNKWIGSIDHGLMKFDGKKWTSYEYEGAIEGKFVQDLLVDTKGRLWVGTTKSLTVFDGISWQSYTDKLPSEYVAALEEDVNGNIWIATSSGLVRYDNNSFSVFNSENTNVPLRNLTSLSSSKNGDLWIGTNLEGFIKYSAGTWTLFQTNQSLSLVDVSNIIQDLIVDNNGIVWIFHSESKFEGLSSSLTYLSGSLWRFKQLPLLYPLEIYSFYLDNENNIWMAINGGLIRYNQAFSSIKVYDSETYGFFSNDATSFCLDLNGNGWLTTKGGGITKIKKSTFLIKPG